MNFSSRLPHEIHPNALSLLVDEKRRAGVPILDLTESNPTRAGIVYPEGFLTALSDSRAAVYEPEPFGLPAARELIGIGTGCNPAGRRKINPCHRDWKANP